MHAQTIGRRTEPHLDPEDSPVSCSRVKRVLKFRDVNHTYPGIFRLATIQACRALVGLSIERKCLDTRDKCSISTGSNLAVIYHSIMSLLRSLVSVMVTYLEEYIQWELHDFTEFSPRPAILGNDRLGLSGSFRRTGS